MEEVRSSWNHNIVFYRLLDCHNHQLRPVLARQETMGSQRHLRSMLEAFHPIEHRNFY